MTQYNFEAFDPDEQSTTTKEFQAVSLDTILQEFQYFLKGAGFEFDGNIGIVPEDNFEIPYDDMDIEITNGDMNMYSHTLFDDFNIEVK